MNFYKILFFLISFIVFDSHYFIFSQSDTTKPNPCETKSDCFGCNCLLRSDPNFTLGIDVAFQGIEGGLKNIKWDSVLTNNNIKFVFIKKSTGCDTSTKRIKYWKSFITREKVSYDNDWFFYKNWDLLNDYKNKTGSKIILGIYHYFYNNTSYDLQTETFLRNLNFSDGDLPPVLDLEDTAMAGIDSKELGENISNWISTVEQSTHRKVMIYTSKYFWDKYMNKLDAETKNILWQHPIWQAQFNNKKDQPDILNGWNKWNFWQYCGDCYINGITGIANVNLFNGSEQDLENFIKGSFIK